MPRPVTIEDYRRLARRRLPAAVFDYLDGGAGGERGPGRNRAALDKVLFKPKPLTDVSSRDASIALFGKTQPLPFVIAPTGLNGVLRPDGDIILARAARKAGIPFTLSTASTSTIEEVAEGAGGDLWFQLYVVQRELARKLVKRALVAGYQALVLTVDVPVGGRRERDLRSGFGIPFRPSARLMLDCARRPLWSLRQLRHGLPQLANMADREAGDANAQALLMQRQMDASFAWDDLKALRDAWPRKLLVKGILSGEVAKSCIAHGVDGIVLSNHGGRQLEDVPAPIDVLRTLPPEIRTTVLVDSGIRSGADAAKALALGADAVMLGRATLYGLAARGAAGVDDVLAILREQLDNTLALAGCPRAAELSRDNLMPDDPEGG